MPSTDDYIRSITAGQSRLYAFIMSLVGNRAQVEDILQEVNLVIWRKLQEGAEIANFPAWSMQVAYLQVLAHRKRQSRDLLIFDDDLLRVMEPEITARARDIDARIAATQECLSHLPVNQKQLIQRRYELGEAVAEIADDTGTTPNAVSKLLQRIRMILLKCIERRLAAHE